MNIVKAIVVSLSLPLILAACGTTPNSKYYLLSAEVTEFPTKPSPSLGVGPIKIPEYLNRNSLIYKREGNRLHIAHFERWAEPLDYSIERVVRLNLASILDTGNVQGYPWSNNERPDYAVAITVINLDVNDEQARLIVEWQIRRPAADETLIRKINALQTKIPKGPVTAAEVAPAYINLFLQLSEIIAGEISNHLKTRQKSEETD